MPAQKCEPGKNYIGLKIDDDEERRVIELTVARDRRMRDYFLGLVSVMFNRRGEAR